MFTSESRILDRRLRRSESVLFDLAIQSPLANSQQAGGFLTVAVSHFERFLDVITLDVVHRAADQSVSTASGWTAGRRWTAAVVGITVLGLGFLLERAIS